MSAAELAPLIRERRVSPVELVKATIERVDRYNNLLGSYITVLREQAIEEARNAEEEIGAGHYRGPLHGIPVAHKDNYFTRNVLTTANSRLKQDFVPDFDATAVRLLKEAGTVLLGKLNTYEFACGGMEFHPETKNPWDLTKVTGGSSAGSGNALAAGLVTVATGSDTGGSIRVPAGFCGIVGFKPTYGLVSRHGIFPFSWSLDHAGPMARTVRDVALMMNVLAVHDPLDPTSVHHPPRDYVAALDSEVKGLRIGVPAEYFLDKLDKDVDHLIKRAIASLEAMGATLIDVRLPMAKHAMEVCHAIMDAEGVSYHEPYIRTHPELYSERARTRFLAALTMPVTSYLKAQRVRRLICEDAGRAFANIDVLVTPTSPIPAFPIGTKSIMRAGEAATFAEALGSFTLPFNVTGQPALSMPCGMTSDGLPVGLQIIGKPFGEEAVLRAAQSCESESSWAEHRPPLPI